MGQGDYGQVSGRGNGELLPTKAKTLLTRMESRELGIRHDLALLDFVEASQSADNWAEVLGLVDAHNDAQKPLQSLSPAFRDIFRESDFSSHVRRTLGEAEDKEITAALVLFALSVLYELAEEADELSL